MSHDERVTTNQSILNLVRQHLALAQKEELFATEASRKRHAGAVFKAFKECNKLRGDPASGRRSATSPPRWSVAAKRRWQRLPRPLRRPPAGSRWRQPVSSSIGP